MIVRTARQAGQDRLSARHRPGAHFALIPPQQPEHRGGVAARSDPLVGQNPFQDRDAVRFIERRLHPFDQRSQRMQLPATVFEQAQPHP